MFKDEFLKALSDARESTPFFLSALLILSYFFFTNYIKNRGKKDKEILDRQIEKIAGLVSGTTHKDELKEFTNQTKLTDNHTEAIHMLQNELEVLKFEIRNNKNTWSLVEGLIENYHKQALRQASIQFWFSAVAAIIGLGFIIISLFLSESATVYEKIIGTLPGVTIDLIAALFFKQAEQTRQRATELYDRLRLDKEREEAIKLIETIDDPILKSVVKAQLALKIGGVDASLSDLSSILRNEQQKTT
ncbi:TRADD-N-associated membrane domain-containing protein [Paenibacillus sp. P13VS]|uniref:TRADD-N-associated membrane domain-containing protein n=1 Tax=Paenibacillus sp. P13VS TaxID=2697367 RepID=UPI00187B225C|nr:hypothetical protein [Paenibacillus sp. P13VS]MBE7682040.1 hypothetical protein [Paenibacillus sp. P13VS]